MIGERIRSIRKRKNLTIVELSEQINVTSGYISQIERDLISPSLSVLRRMSEALGIPLSVLFSNETAESVTTISKDERTKVKFGDINVEFEYLTPVSKNNKKSENVEAFLFKVPPKTWVSDNAVLNEAKECIFVLKGRLEWHVGDKTYMISKGDSICVPENNGHMIFNPDEEETEAICILSPTINNLNNN